MNLQLGNFVKHEFVDIDSDIYNKDLYVPTPVKLTKLMSLQAKSKLLTASEGSTSLESYQLFQQDSQDSHDEREND